MARRDRVTEILSITQRGAVPSGHDFYLLWDHWTKLAASGVDSVTDFFPIRCVTLIEVFARRWIAALIDHGSPYAERAAQLRADLKFDYAIASSLHGRKVSLGQLVAHSVSLQNVESLAATFNTLLSSDVFLAISRTSDRYEIESEGAAAEPIIKDIEHLRKTLVRLFEVRHILVHELPKSPPYVPNEIEGFLAAATDFVNATEQTLETMLFGIIPISQAEMNEAARSAAEAASRALADVVENVAKSDGTNTIHQVQELWEKFKEADALRQSEYCEGGTMHPMVYYGAESRLANNRINELGDWLDQGRA